MTDEHARAEFMGRVRAGLGRATDGRGPGEPPAIDETLFRLAPADAPMADLFAERARAIGAIVHRTNDAGVTAALSALLARLDVRSVTTSIDDAGLAKRAGEALAAANVTVADWRRGDGLSMHYDADAGITDVRAAIAESGTIVIASGERHSRGTFLVPPVHVALVRARTIVADLVDLWPRDDAPDMPAAIVLITGPSKTADIEGILVTGVHGPGAVHVIIIDE